jgi:hypothetical protein
MMNDQDFPALYVSADRASIEAQSELLLIYRLNGILLVSGATLALFSSMSRIVAILTAVAFLSSLFLAILSNYNKLHKKWYQARALAESVKTATWRFMMDAEPFALPPEESMESFRCLLTELLNENKGIGSYLAGDWSDKDQITQKMLEIRSSSYPEKRNIYLDDRIDEQRKWYAFKSGENRKSAKYWFIILCFFYGLAILFSFVRIAYPEQPFLPIEVFAVAASTVIGWTQIKRFAELSSAYGLTAHEIGIIKSRYSAVDNDIKLSSFVSDAENAFSREHTQWAARRDH